MISVFELRPGDRVILNCPKARRITKRQAEFVGLFEGEMALAAGNDLVVGRFRPGNHIWAKFLMQTATGGQIVEYPGGGAVAGVPPFAGVTALFAGFVVEQDGGMREEDGRRVFIEQRFRAGAG